MATCFRAIIRIYFVMQKNYSINQKNLADPSKSTPANNDNMSVEKVARELINHFGHGKIVINKKRNFGHEADLLQLNCDKAKRILGWESRWNTKETIRKVAPWYKFDQTKKIDHNNKSNK